MKPFLLAFLALFLAGCETRAERAQHAADTDAGLAAVSMNLADMLPAIRTLTDGDTKAKLLALAQSSQDIVATSRAYLAAVADVPKAELPVPAQTPEAIRADGGTGLKAATPPDPTGNALWAILGTAGLAALYGIGKVAPNVPGLGTLVGGVANLAWSALAHRDQLAADKAQATAADAAGVALPILAQIQALPPGTLPPAIQAAVNDQRIAVALAAIVKG